MNSFADMLRKIEVRYGEDGWHGDEEVDPKLYAVFDTGGRLQAQELTVTPRMWQAGPPGTVMSIVADMLPDHPGLLTPFREPGWMGIAFAAEVWSLQIRDPEMVDELMEVTAKREVHRHPDRLTSRLVYGITRDQHRVMVMRMQDGPDGAVVEEDANFPGAIQDGLVKLVATVDELLEV